MQTYFVAPGKKIQIDNILKTSDEKYQNHGKSTPKEMAEKKKSRKFGRDVPVMIIFVEVLLIM